MKSFTVNDMLVDMPFDADLSKKIWTIIRFGAGTQACDFKDTLAPRNQTV